MTISGDSYLLGTPDGVLPVRSPTTRLRSSGVVRASKEKTKALNYALFRATAEHGGRFGNLSSIATRILDRIFLTGLQHEKSGAVM